MIWRGIAAANFSSFRLPRSAGFAIIASACLVLYGPLRAEWWQLLALAIAFAAALPALRHPAAAPWASVALCTLLGAVVTLAVSQDRLAQRWSPAAEGERVIGTVHIDSLIESERGVLEFDATVEIESPAPLARTLRVRVRWNEMQAARVQSGDVWRLMLRMSVPRPARNPGGFDDAMLALRERLDARATVVSSWAGTTQIARGEGGLLRLRARIADDIRRFVVDRDAAALFAGLAVGATGAISREQWQVFSITGTTHLVAISGLHVTLFAWFAAAFARLVWRYSPILAQHLEREIFAALIGVTAALGYALLAGFEIPTQRTVVMLAVWWWAKLSGREQRGFEVLGLAMLAVWLLDPLAPLAAGFWLSFTAMGILLLGDVVRSTREALRGKPSGPLASLLHHVREMLRVQWRVSLALVPATLALFSNVSVAGIAVNLLAIPLFSFVLVPLVLLSTAVQSFSQVLAGWLWMLTENIYLISWPLMRWAAEQPLAGGAVSVSPLALIALTLALPLWLLPTPWRWRLLSGVLLLPILWFLMSPRVGVLSSIPTGVARVQVLDGGDGAALLVFTRHHTLVYDTAEVFGSQGRRAETLVLPALRAAGREAVDHLVLSRAHGLRAAGFGVLLARTTVRAVSAGGHWVGAPPLVRSCAKARRWQWDEVRFHVFSAGGEDRSCVLRISVRDGASLLVPERLDAQEARALVADPAHRAALAAEVVLAPRRGSPAAVDAAFVAAVAPRWVIVSAREHDERRARQLVARWALPPDRILSTATAGMIEIELAPASPARVAAGMSDRASRIWH